MISLNHPQVKALAAGISTGQFGLPHALHGDYVAPGDIDDLVTEAVGVATALLGPATGDVQAVRHGNGITLTLHWQKGVMVTLLVGAAGPSVTSTLHRYHLLGSHGQAMLDLEGPSLRLYADGVQSIPFGAWPADDGAEPSESVRKVVAAAHESASSGGVVAL